MIKNLDDLEVFAKGFLGQLTLPAVIGLSGPLGAGKTTFIRLLVSLAAKASAQAVPRMTSPTYVIHQSYPDFKPRIEHFDLYRLENLSRESLIETGYFDALEAVETAKGILFVEWPEKAKSLQDLELTHHLQWQILDDGSRQIMPRS